MVMMPMMTMLMIVMMMMTHIDRHVDTANEHTDDHDDAGFQDGWCSPLEPSLQDWCEGFSRSIRNAGCHGYIKV